MTFVRSLLYNVAFYLMTVVMLIVTAPFFLIFPERKAVGIVQLWGRIGVFLLRVIAGTRLEVRGLEHLPPGASLIASKHQSMFETFALLPVLPYPTFVLKRELRWIPVFGWYTIRSGMIPVDRRKGATALRDLARRARRELDKGRQLLIFPEGTRRPPGAEPAYRSGIALLYKELGVPVVPVALNSGLFWPRREFLRHPGTVVVEFLPPIPPGLPSKEFMAKLQAAIEPAADRLLLEAAAAPNPPPFPATTAVRIATLR